MTLAYVTIPGRGETDTFIAELVQVLTSRGLRLAGTVRSGQVDRNGHPCDMDVRVLPDGPIFRISQPLGKGARGCRLDGGIIEDISTGVEARLSRADLLIVNKFGKQEAQGRGLCRAISMAMSQGIPTLVGVNQMNVPEFQDFAGGLAETLPSEIDTVLTWYDALETLRRGALV